MYLRLSLTGALMTRRFRSVVAILSLVPAALSAQGAAAAAKAFFGAQSDKNWLGMADLVDSSSLRAVRDQAMKISATFATMAKPETKAILDSLGVSNMSRAVEGIQGMFGGTPLLAMSFARVKDGAEFAAMTDREIMARWFEAKSPGYLTTVMSGGMFKGMLENFPGGAAAEVKSAMAGIVSTPINWDVVGEIADGPGVSHVIYRAGGGSPAQPTSVLTFHMSGGQWRVWFMSPDDQLADLAQHALRAVTSNRH